MRLLLYISLFLFPLIASSQNLVPNPGFEEFDEGAPVSEYGLHKIKHWYQPTGGTSDCFHTSHPKDFTGVPANDFGIQEPRSGNGYGGFCAYMPAYREYLAVELLRPLEAGKQYRIEFHVSLSENSAYAVNKVQALFTNERILDSALLYVLGHKPQVSASGTIEERKGWVPVSGEFIAKGGEKYLLLGTFLHDKLLEVKKVKVLHRGRKTDPWAYYFVDDVSVCPLDENGNCMDKPLKVPQEPLPVSKPKYEIGKPFVLKNVYFDVASARLQERSFPSLDSLADHLLANPRLTIFLGGHTDSTGNELDNWPLSGNRAKAVGDYLVSKGVERKRVSGKGYASSRPADTNATIEGRRNNRRVEAVLEEQ